MSNTFERKGLRGKEKRGEGNAVRAIDRGKQVTNG